MSSETDTAVVPVVPLTDSVAPPAKTLSAADFRRAKELPRKIKPVNVPELGGVVYVRELSALEKDRLDDVLTDDKGKPVNDNFRAKLFATCACDAAGVPLFGLTPAEVAEIGSWPLSIVEPVYDAASQLNMRRASERATEKKD